MRGLSRISIVMCGRNEERSGRRRWGRAVRRSVAGLVLTTAVVGISADRASAADDEVVFEFRFTDRTGSGVLTDCVPGSPAGTHCTAVNVFAFEQRIDDFGGRSEQSGMSISLFDVVLTGQAPGFVATQTGAGLAPDAEVKISGGLGHGEASAFDVALCESFACPPGAPQSVSVTIEWTAIGEKSVTKFRDRTFDGVCEIDNRFVAKSTLQSIVGTIDGRAVTQARPDLFPAFLQRTKQGFVQSCSFV